MSGRLLEGRTEAFELAGTLVPPDDLNSPAGSVGAPIGLPDRGPKLEPVYGLF